MFGVLSCFKAPTLTAAQVKRRPSLGLDCQIQAVGFDNPRGRIQNCYSPPDHVQFAVIH